MKRGIQKSAEDENKQICQGKKTSKLRSFKGNYFKS